jgi:hypothetical protein
MSHELDKKELRDEIRKQFVSPATARFLQALPSFKVDPDLPDRLDGLLAELDRTEREHRRASRDGLQRSADTHKSPPWQMTALRTTARK